MPLILYYLNASNPYDIDLFLSNPTLKDSLKEIMEGEYIGDLMVNSICYDIFNDDELCKNRLMMEIRIYQQKIQNGKVNYKNIL